MRRELDSRLAAIEQILKSRRFPKFVVKEMECMFVDELRSSISLLMANLGMPPCLASIYIYEYMYFSIRVQPTALECT